MQLSPYTVSLQPYCLSQRNKVEGTTGTLEGRQPALSERLCQILVSSVLKVCKEYQLWQGNILRHLYIISTKYLVYVLNMYRKLLNYFSKGNLIWLWDSLHQTRESLSYKAEAAGTALYSFRDTTCALHRAHLTRLLRNPITCSQMTVFVGLMKIFLRKTHCWRWPELIQHYRSSVFPVSADMVPFRAQAGSLWVKHQHVQIPFAID